MSIPVAGAIGGKNCGVTPFPLPGRFGFILLGGRFGSRNPGLTGLTGLVGFLGFLILSTIPVIGFRISLFSKSPFKSKRPP